MKLNNKFKQFKIANPFTFNVLALCLLIAFSSTELSSQDAGTAEILELLEKDKKSKSSGDSEDAGYKSFVQNEYMSITKQLSNLSFDEKQDLISIRRQPFVCR